MTKYLSSISALALAIISSGLVGCQEGGPRPYTRQPSLGTLQGALNAYCEANVIGVGSVDIEGDYLPRVINCENGGAGLEALKAQAVAARSYLYYRLNNSGDINDGQSDQVYTCGREPSAQHFAAVEATSGEVLSYQDAVIAAFYVAGAIPSAPSCIGAEGDSDPFNTERYVTYNEGRQGDDVIQTPLGWVDPANLYNRGCKSQNGASCLGSAGFTYDEILRFYYGEDITLERAMGACVLEEPGGEEPTGGELIGGDDVMPDMSVAGASLSGEYLAGDVMGGEPLSGEGMAGSDVAGDPAGVGAGSQAGATAGVSGGAQTPAGTPGPGGSQGAGSSAGAPGAAGVMGAPVAGDESMNPMGKASTETSAQCGQSSRSSSSTSLLLITLLGVLIRLKRSRMSPSAH